MASANEYPVTVRPLSDDDGGGFLAEVPDLPGCASDGETEAEALANARDAIVSWIEAAEEDGRTVPEPTVDASYSGRLLLRTPRSLHRRLAERARSEGVSLNTITVALIAEGLGRGVSSGRGRRRRRAAA
jgi:antitoxin HicB